MMIALALAFIFKLNKVITLVASNISIPPMIPFILLLSYVTGGIVLGNDFAGLSMREGIDFEYIRNNLLQYIAGSLVFGVIASCVAGLTTFVLLKIFRSAH
jgi:uncharacterized protein (DUF2062 family)